MKTIYKIGLGVWAAITIVALLLFTEQVLKILIGMLIVFMFGVAYFVGCDAIFDINVT